MKCQFRSLRSKSNVAGFRASREQIVLIYRSYESPCQPRRMALCNSWHVQFELSSFLWRTGEHPEYFAKLCEREHDSKRRRSEKQIALGRSPCRFTFAHFRTFCAPRCHHCTLTYLIWPLNATPKQEKLASIVQCCRSITAAVFVDV